MKRLDFRDRNTTVGTLPGGGTKGLHRIGTALLALAALLAAGAVAAADYVNDPSWGWGTGRMQDEAFSGSGSQDYVGRSVAKFDNGDIVVAGTVPHASGFGAIGLVRYAADGTSGRVVWTNPGPYGTNGNQYAVYPGTSGFRIEAVRKVIVHGDLMFVLAETFLGTQWDTSIYVFGSDGSFKSQLLGVDTIDNASGRAVWGGGIAAYTTQTFVGSTPTMTHHLVYAGRKKVAAGNERITYARWTFTTAGVVTPATTLLHPAITECGPTTHCSGFDIAVGGSSTIGGAPRVYITGSRYETCTAICYDGWWAFAAQINPSNGNPAGVGFRYMTRGRGRAIAVNRYSGFGGTADDVYVLAERDRNCRNGMVVAALRTEVPTNWEKVIGGSDATGTACNLTISLGIVRTVVPAALALQDGRLAAAGYGYVPPGTCSSPPCEDIVDGAIAVLDAGSGNLISPGAAGNGQPKYYAYTNTSGTRTRHSGFRGIVAAGDGRFTVAGDVRYPNTHDNVNYRGKKQFASLRVLESTGSGNGDLPFGDGFEEPQGGGNNGSPSSGLSAQGQAFFGKLFQSQQVRTLVGHQASTIAGVGWRHWQCQNDCSDFYTSANNRHAAVAGWELESRHDAPDETQDWITYALTIQEALKARNRGAINTFGLHMRRLDNPGSGSKAVQPAGHCAQLVPGGTYNAQYRAKLDGYATQLNTLQVGGQAVPFLLRPFHEADGNWFWWGTTGCDDASFKALFRYTVQYLRTTKGLGHMLVVYAPGIFTTQAQYLARYPGDDVVDVIAFDQYLTTPVDAYHGESVAGLTNKLDIVHALAQARGKIAAWAETGQKGVATDTAYSQLAQAITNSGAKLAYAMFWANYTTEDNDFYLPYPGSPQARRMDFNGFIAPPRVAAGEFPSVYP